MRLSLDTAVQCFVEMVVSAAERFILTRVLREIKGTHPWLNNECQNAIRLKHSREGTSEYKEACEICTRTLRVAYSGYVDKTREELRSLPK